MIAPREIVCALGVLLPSLRTAMAVLDAVLDRRPDLDVRIDRFREAFEASWPHVEITRGQALDAIESPGRASAVTAVLPRIDQLGPGDRVRLVASVELARRAAGVGA